MVVSALCGLLVVSAVLTGFSQEQRDETRQRAAERVEGLRTDQRSRNEQRRDPASRRSRGKPRGVIEGERADTPQGSHFVRPQTIQREMPGRPINPVRGDYRQIFEGIQHGMKTGNVATFSQHFGSQVLFNLRGGESGYYSANQAYYLLESYLKSRKLVYFDFSTIGESESNPYATGSAGFNVKGSREVAQIYVSLSLAGERWVISQINIY